MTPLRHGDLTGDDFYRLGTTAFLLGAEERLRHGVQRAYQAHVGAGQPLAAVRSGSCCSPVHARRAGGRRRLGGAAASGCWTSRGDVVERGYLLVPDVSGTFRRAEWEPARSFATDRRLRSSLRRPRPPRDGLCSQGRLVLIYAGRVTKGWPSSTRR